MGFSWSVYKPCACTPANSNLEVLPFRDKSNSPSPSHASWTPRSVGDMCYLVPGNHLRRRYRWRPKRSRTLRLLILWLGGSRSGFPLTKVFPKELARFHRIHHCFCKLCSSFLLSFPLSLLSGLCLRPLPRLLPVVLQAETHLEPNRTSLEDPLEIFSPTAPKWLWFEFSNELSAGKCSRNALTSVQKLCETSLALASSLGLTAFRRAACLGSPS